MSRYFQEFHFKCLVVFWHILFKCSPLILNSLKQFFQVVSLNPHKIWTLTASLFFRRFADVEESGLLVLDGHVTPAQSCSTSPGMWTPLVRSKRKCPSLSRSWSRDMQAVWSVAGITSLLSSLAVPPHLSYLKSEITSAFLISKMNMFTAQLTTFTNWKLLLQTLLC